MDEYELPIAVADTASELGNMLGVTKNAVLCSIQHQKSGFVKKGRYRRVYIGEDEDELQPNDQ
jgi:hypothetical protein